MFSLSIICFSEYHSVFLNISCSHFVVYVREISLCEEKGLSVCMDVTGYHWNAATRVGCFSSQ
jgi:hypothetical protein